MLQQTQVTRVEGYYHRFLEQYPSLEALASATPAMVRESWSGLGYYRRADNLHRLARTVAAEHGGSLPREVDALRSLPGIGRYTAGAIASFAYEAAVPAVDTNVGRVIRRAFHPRAGSTAHDERKLWDTAQALLPRRGRAAWALNQGLMELGAMVCTARRAWCESCPVTVLCATGRRRVPRPPRSTGVRGD